jgi:hypothetical protein
MEEINTDGRSLEGIAKDATNRLHEEQKLRKVNREFLRQHHEAKREAQLHMGVNTPRLIVRVEIRDLNFIRLEFNLKCASNTINRL